MVLSLIDASICIWTFVFQSELLTEISKRLKSQHKIPDPELPTIIESSTSHILPANTSRVWERSLRPSLFSTHDPTQAMSQEKSTQATEMAIRATGLRKEPSPPFPDSVSPSPGSCVFPPLALHLPSILSSYMVAKWSPLLIVLAQKSTTSVPSGTGLYDLTSSWFTLIMRMLSYPNLHPL